MYVIRRAKKSDAPEILVLNHRNLPEKYTLSFIEYLLEKPGASYVVERDRTLVGYLIAIVDDSARIPIGKIEGPLGHIVSIAVDPEHRRKGLARRLMIKALEDLRGRVDLVMLEVRVSNEPAISLYASLGFSIEHIRPGYYRDGETGLIMTYRYE